MYLGVVPRSGPANHTFTTSFSITVSAGLRVEWRLYSTNQEVVVGRSIEAMPRCLLEPSNHA